MIDITAEVGDRITVWLSDCTFVGRLDRVDEDVILVDGVRIRRVDVRGIECDGDVHPDGPCDDYRCCIS